MERGRNGDEAGVGVRENGKRGRDRDEGRGRGREGDEAGMERR